MSKPATVERLSATKRLRIYAANVEHHYGLPRHAADMLRKIADELEAEVERLRAALENLCDDMDTLGTYIDEAASDCDREGDEKGACHWKARSDEQERWGRIARAVLDAGESSSLELSGNCVENMGTLVKALDEHLFGDETEAPKEPADD